MSTVWDGHRKENGCIWALGGPDIFLSFVSYFCGIIEYP